MDRFIFIKERNIILNLAKTYAIEIQDNDRKTDARVVACIDEDFDSRFILHEGTHEECENFLLLLMFYPSL